MAQSINGHDVDLIIGGDSNDNLIRLSLYTRTNFNVFLWGYVPFISEQLHSERPSF